MPEDKMDRESITLYSWIQTHKELVDYLLTKENSQKELIQVLKSVGITGFTDRDKDGNESDLEVIDPFTFFCYIYKFGEDKRLEILQQIARKLNITVPSDTFGVPSANAQKVWLFPYKQARNDDDVSKLWNLFRNILNDQVTDEEFKDVLKIKNTGPTKLSEAFFYVQPKVYFPINGPTKPFIKEKYNIDPTFNSFTDYKNILKRLIENTDTPLYELSYEAWKWKEENKVRDVKPEYERKSHGNVKQYWLYSPGDNGEHWEEFYEKGIMALGWDELGDLENYKSKEELISTLQQIENTTGSKKNDATANYDFKNSISIGDIVIVKKGLFNLLGFGVVTSEYYYNEERETYQKCRDVDWQLKGTWDAGHRMVSKTLTEIGWFETQLPEYEYYYERLMGAMGQNFKENQKTPFKMPLNQILYGPPGTGKTYQLQDTYFKQFTVQETSLNREQYLENIVSDLKWWQVAAIALLDLKRSKVTDIVSHELLLIKIKLSNSKNPNATIWGYLQHYTDPECEYVKVAERSSNPIFYKDQNSVWEVKKDLLEQFYPEAFSILEEVKNYHPNPDKFIKNYEFVTFHQSFSYEDFVEGIKPNLDDEENNVSYRIEDGIFKKMCLKADADRENQYAIFIDEINRGNVSAIFGELITLIEDDKRLGEENELRAKLPYSKTELGVPPNLHIFGTMNTADRSVEALDTALRRRFTFLEIMPEPQLLGNINFNGFDLHEVLKTINERIEALLDRDHTIGQSYFMKIMSGDVGALAETFQNKIIPLLQEYFYHDYEKIALILGEGFVERKEGKVTFAKFALLEDPELTPSFELRKNIEDIEAAVMKLLNGGNEEAA